MTWHQEGESPRQGSLITRDRARSSDKEHDLPLSGPRLGTVSSGVQWSRASLGRADVWARSEIEATLPDVAPPRWQAAFRSTARPHDPATPRNAHSIKPQITPSSEP